MVLHEKKHGPTSRLVSCSPESSPGSSSSCTWSKPTRPKRPIGLPKGPETESSQEPMYYRHPGKTYPSSASSQKKKKNPSLARVLIMLGIGRPTDRTTSTHPFASSTFDVLLLHRWLGTGGARRRRCLARLGAGPSSPTALRRAAGRRHRRSSRGWE